MDIKKLRKIVLYNREIHLQTEEQVRRFCGTAHVDPGRLEIKNLLRQICRSLGIYLLELPMKDQETGSIFFVISGVKYLLINSSIPRMNVNFAIAHELYHIMNEETAVLKAADIFVMDSYEGNDHEMRANAFAGELLMPEEKVNMLLYQFLGETDSAMECIVRLMDYFSTTYMSVLIRLIELGKIRDNEEILQQSAVDYMAVKEAFMKYGLNTEILEPSYRDDYEDLRLRVQQAGEELIGKGLMSEYQMGYLLEHIQKVYERICGK